MHFTQIGQRRYAQFPRLRQAAGLVHAFSTRPANLAQREGPGAADRAAERRAMVADWGLTPDRLRYCEQVHQPGLVVVDESCPAGLLTQCDGSLTALPGVPLMTFSADCPLVLAFDPLQRVLGLAHASWRCTVAGMTTRLIERMTTQFGCRPADLLAGVGPGAGPCCYEVQSDVYEAAAALAARDRFFQRRDGRLYFDLWEANRAQFIEMGVHVEHVEAPSLCTLCHNDVFYSYRREGAGCGHFALLAALCDA
jgi:polyphenol oxidase